MKRLMTLLKYKASCQETYVEWLGEKKQILNGKTLVTANVAANNWKQSNTVG